MKERFPEFKNYFVTSKIEKKLFYLIFCNKFFYFLTQKLLENPINYIHSKDQIVSYYINMKDEIERLFGGLEIESFIN